MVQLPSSASAGATAVDFNPDRRRLLKTGLGGSLLLGTASLTAGLSGCATAPAAPVAGDGSHAAQPGYRFLSEDDLILMGALLPVVLGSAWPTDPAAQAQAREATLRRMDTGLYRLGAPNQKEMRKLFDLLNLGLTRALVARVWSSWDTATPGEIDAFLQRWRNSSVGLFNQGYIALARLCNMSWYGHADQWAQSGYPGPPAWVTAALPQFQTPAAG